MVHVITGVLLTKGIGLELDRYKVNLIIDGTILRLEGFGQGIGNLKTEGSFTLDIVQAKHDATLLLKTLELTFEARDMVQKAIELGFKPCWRHIFDAGEITQRLLDYIQLNSTRELVNAFVSASADASNGSFNVEVIAIERGLLKVAKVQSDFYYEFVSYAKNDAGLSVRVGDVVRVAWSDCKILLNLLEVAVV